MGMRSDNCRGTVPTALGCPQDGPFRRRSVMRRGRSRATSIPSCATFDPGAPQQPRLDSKSLFLLAFQQIGFVTYFAGHSSCFAESAPLSFRNRQIPAEKVQDACVSHAPRTAGWTTPPGRPGAPWRAPDRRGCAEYSKESRRIPVQADWLDASGRADACLASQPATAVGRSRARTLRQSPFRWRDGAWPVLPETASANRPAASRLS